MHCRLGLLALAAGATALTAPRRVARAEGGRAAQEVNDRAAFDARVREIKAAALAAPRTPPRSPSGCIQCVMADPSELVSQPADGLEEDEYPVLEEKNLTEEQMKHRIREKERCEGMLATSFSSSRLVQFMFRALSRSGCNTNPFEFVKCKPCNNKIAAAVQHEDNGDVSVIVCQNHLKSQKDLDTVLTHELIHVFDSCRAYVDFSSCRHHACTEIRAANLSGDCLFSRELKVGRVAIMDHHNRCVKRRATQSVLMNPHCPPMQARQAVDEVFEQCIKDTEPFGSIPY